MIIIYLLATLGIGVWFTRRASGGTEEFFKASGRIPAWAAGFSIYATTLSAITYMSTPEQAFLTDWSYAAGNIAIFAIVPLLVIFYIPFFRKLDVTTAYEYLEEVRSEHPRARLGPSSSSTSAASPSSSTSRSAITGHRHQPGARRRSRRRARSSTPSRRHRGRHLVHVVQGIILPVGAAFILVRHHGPRRRLCHRGL